MLRSKTDIEDYAAQVPPLGGTLLAFPSLPPILVPTGPLGEIPLVFTLPQGLPSGMELWIQWAVQDTAAAQGVALSHAVVGVTP